MTRHIFRKIPSIILLIIVIITSLLFSLWIQSDISEGLTTTIKIPPSKDLKKLTGILEGSISTIRVKYNVSVSMKKIILMRNTAVKYTALNDVYNMNTDLYYKDLVQAIQTPAQTDSQGNAFDENAISIKNREIANTIVSSGKKPTFNKLCELLELTGKDRIMNNISTKYESQWIAMVSDFVSRMKNSKTVKKYKSCSQFTNCTACTNGKVKRSMAQCYWNHDANVCGKSASYGTSTKCPVSDTVL